ncbi:MAG: hypothetical protein HZA52_07015 [Planctomycetes bacterium]|nr:hypothetical protein [Planctomycetota bacterium]
MTADRELELDVGAVLVPEVRVGGTIASATPIRPSREYLRRFPPVGVIAFGRTPQGASSPSELLAAVRAELAEDGATRCFAACDLEQGAGLHFPTATRLPPALALAAREAGSATPGARGPTDATDASGVSGSFARSAGALTALEAREHAIELVLAPVADVNTRRSNPLIAVRSFGDTPERAAPLARAFLEGLHQGGAGGCAKHYPGHGDTEEDSHRELARVARSREELAAVEWAPFRALIDAGVDTVMVSHLDVPALTGEPGLPATLSPRALAALRGELGFHGAVLTDALNMHALTGLESIHARALAAGCDGLLCPTGNEVAAEELLRAVRDGALSRERLRAAADTLRGLRAKLDARRASPPAERSRLSRWFAGSHAASGCDPAVFGAPAERAAFARRLAGEALVLAGGEWPWKPGAPCEVLAPVPSGAGAEARQAIHELRRDVVDPSGTPNALLPVLAEVRAFDGTYGVRPEDVLMIEAKLADLRRLGWRTAIAWFASPQSLPPGWWGRRDLALVLAFAPTPPMVRAVGDFLQGRVQPLGSLPTTAH